MNEPVYLELLNLSNEIQTLLYTYERDYIYNQTNRNNINNTNYHNMNYVNNRFSYMYPYFYQTPTYMYNPYNYGNYYFRNSNSNSQERVSSSPRRSLRNYRNELNNINSRLRNLQVTLDRINNDYRNMNNSNSDTRQDTNINTSETFEIPTNSTNNINTDSNGQEFTNNTNIFGINTDPINTDPINTDPNINTDSYINNQYVNNEPINTEPLNFNTNTLKDTQLSVFKNKLNNLESYVFSKGKFSKNKPIPTRVLSKIIIKKNLFNDRQIKKTLKIMAKFKKFILVIINSPILKDKKNTDLTLRYYGIGAQILKEFNVKNMILISRSKKKLIALEGFGLRISKQIIIK